MFKIARTVLHFPSASFSSTATKLLSSQSIQTKISKPNIQALKIVNPLEHQDFFGLNESVNLEEMFKARCHYGHDAGLRCPWMSEYLFGTRIKTDIIDLDKSVPLLQNALNFIAHIAFKDGIILMITRYPQHIPLIERTALESGEYSNCKPWRNGSFTDSMRRFGTVVRLPDVCIFFHTHEKLNEAHNGINEASRMLIPTVGVCDSDADPSLITYPVPGNDDSIVSVQLYAGLVKRAILRGKEKREELKKDGWIVDYSYRSKK